MNTTSTASLVWIREDLRTADNPALHAAAQLNQPILPVFIYDETDPNAYGGAQKWWLHHSLQALQKDLPLIFLKGDPTHLLPQLIQTHNISHVFWNRCYTPHAIQRDSKIKKGLQNQNIKTQIFNASLLHEPTQVRTKTGGPFKVFTPFWKHLKQQNMPQPLPAPTQMSFINAKGEALNSWHLNPTTPDWAGGLRQSWTPGEDGAWQKFEDFLKNNLQGYAENRNRPDLPNVSRLSPHLHWGEISPRQIWQRVHQHGITEDADKFLSELAWREFSHHLLVNFPTLPKENWKPAFNAYPWEEDETALHKWQKGLTGYPIVDAGMRELWHTGYMHNRVRMIVASFLIKHLRLHWHHGASWFWDTLVDADLANNSASWQWVAGSGADASPYFRIFNPITQGEKFDPNGTYTRHWLPELAKLPTDYLFKPWEAPDLILMQADVKLGQTYPKLMVDHAQARQKALQGYEAVKQNN